MDGITWPKYRFRAPAHIKLRLPVETQKTDVNWEGARFWNEYIPYLSGFAGQDDESSGRLRFLADDERMEMNAYRRAWYALWLLVAAIGFLLWTIIICLVARKCISARSKPYNNIIVTNNR